MRFRRRSQVEMRVRQTHSQQAASSALASSGISGAVSKGISFPYTAEKSHSVKVLAYWAVLALVAAGTYCAFITCWSSRASAHAGAGGRQPPQQQGWPPAAALPRPGKRLHPLVARGRCWLEQGKAACQAEPALGQPGGKGGGRGSPPVFPRSLLLLVDQARGSLEPHGGSSLGINTNHVPFPSLLTGYKEQGIPQQL